MLAEVEAVLEQVIETHLTCNCLLPDTGYSRHADDSLLSACYELKEGEGAEGSDHVGSVSSYGVPAPLSSPGGLDASASLPAACWGLRREQSHMPGVFDLTWLGARYARIAGVSLGMEDSGSPRPPRRLLLAAGTDGAIRLLHPRTLQTVKQYASVHAEMLTSCTPFLNPFSSTPLSFLCTAHTGAVLVYDAASEAVACELEGHEYDAWCGAVLPTCVTAAGAADTASEAQGTTEPGPSTVLLSGGDDGLMRMYDMRAGYAACGRTRFDAGVVHIAPVVRTARTPVASASVEVEEVLAGATPYVLVGSYDESLSLIDTRFMKRPVAQRGGLGGGVWRCSRCFFPFYAAPAACPDPAEEEHGLSNFSLLESSLQLAPRKGGEASEGFCRNGDVTGVVSEANTLLLPLMQRGAALLSYDVKAPVDEVFREPLYLHRSREDPEEVSGSFMTQEHVSEKCLVYDTAPLSVRREERDGVSCFSARLATCSFYEKQIHLWTVKGLNLMHEVQAAIEAKAVLAASPFQQRRAFLLALRADMLAHRHELVRANRHDCEAFTQQTQPPGAAAVPSTLTNTSATASPASPTPPPLRDLGRDGGTPAHRSRPDGGSGVLPGAHGDVQGRSPATRRMAAPLSPAATPSAMASESRRGSEATPTATKAATAASATALEGNAGGGGPPRAGEVLGPFYQSAFTSRPSHRQRLFPLRFDKVFTVIDYLLDQPDPIAVPQDCWLHRSRSGTRTAGAAAAAAGAGCPAESLSSRRTSTSTATSAPPRSVGWGTDPQIEVCEIRVPLGLVGILSRYRPRMLLDATSMGIFSGNALLLDGGASLFCTNAALMNSVRRALLAVGLPTTCVVHVESYDVLSHHTADWLHMTDRVDLGLVCGPPKLYEFACKNSSIPLIRATSRSCSLFVHESASYDTALRVILNAKLQAPGAANAATTVIMHSKFPRYVELLKDLVDQGVALLGDYPARARAPECIQEIASDEEYRGLSQGLRDFSQTLCIKTVDSVDQALFFLDLFGSKQADGIIASDEAVIADFCTSADSAVVLVNSSTRLSSGNPLGCGPDLAITTSKVHCRGPFTLSALTTRKFVVRSKNDDSALRY